jgi:hypothetical protein
MNETIEIETAIKDRVYEVLKRDLDKNLRCFKKDMRIKALLSYRNTYFPNGDLDYAFHIYASKFIKK